VVADRVRRRHALYCTQSLMLLQAIVLATLTALGVIEVWHVIALALFSAWCPRSTFRCGNRCTCT
jgi:hypothetical protein